MKLNDLREQRALKVAAMRALLEGKDTLTGDEKTAFDKLKAEVTDLEAQEQRAQFLEDAERRALAGQHDQARTEFERQANVLDAIRAQVEQRAITGALAEFQQEARRNGLEARHGGILVPSSIFEKRTDPTYMSTGDAQTPTDYRADQFVGLLRNAMVVRSLGARVLTGLRGDAVIPRQTGAMTASWIAEGDPLTDSKPTFDNITLTPRHVGALTSLSRQLIQQGNPSIEQLVRDDMVAVIGLAVDRAMIHGDSGNDEPDGIINSNPQPGSLASLSWAAVLGLFEQLQLVNVTPNAVLTHPTAATTLASTPKDLSASGDYLLQDGRVNGTPAHITNQLDPAPDSHGSGQLILGDFSQIVIGEWGVTEVLANPFAAGYYERGAVQLRVMHSMDLVIRHPNAFVVVSDL